MRNFVDAFYNVGQSADSAAREFDKLHKTISELLETTDTYLLRFLFADDYRRSINHVRRWKRWD